MQDFVAGSKFGEVAASLFLPGAACGEILRDGRDAKRRIFPYTMRRHFAKALVKESIHKTWKPFQQMQGGNQWKGFQSLPHQLKVSHNFTCYEPKKTSNASHPEFRMNITGPDLHQRLSEHPHLDHIRHQCNDLWMAPNPFRPSQSRQSSWHAGQNSSRFCCFMNANAVRLILALRAEKCRHKSWQEPRPVRLAGVKGLLRVGGVVQKGGRGVA